MDAQKEYFRQLEQFERASSGLIKKGQPYLAVILCHELYRYTYPVEPYDHFTHTNPVEFITNHIRDLNTLAAHFGETVTPYAWKFPKKPKKAALIRRRPLCKFILLSPSVYLLDRGCERAE